MGPGESIIAVIAILATFGGFFGGIGYVVHRVLSHRREIRLAELDAQTRLRAADHPPVSDELLRAVAQELHTQRQMLERLLAESQQRNAALGLPATIHTTEPSSLPEHDALRAPRPGLTA